MKPEHLNWLDDIWQILNEATHGISTLDKAELLP
jgi:hypothetical protein